MWSRCSYSRCRRTNLTHLTCSQRFGMIVDFYSAYDFMKHHFIKFYCNRMLRKDLFCYQNSYQSLQLAHNCGLSFIHIIWGRTSSEISSRDEWDQKSQKTHHSETTFAKIVRGLFYRVREVGTAKLSFQKNKNCSRFVLYCAAKVLSKKLKFQTKFPKNVFGSSPFSTIFFFSFKLAVPTSRIFLYLKILDSSRF